MKKMTFKDLAYKILDEVKRPLTVEEIWEYAQEKNYDKQINSQGKTPPRTIGAQLYVDIRDNPNFPFIKIGTRPVKFFLKHLSDTTKFHEIASDEQKSPKKAKYNFRERDLHPFLTYFANTYMNLFTKTIYHEKSRKRHFNQWLHPDLVGVYFPIDDWNDEVLDFSKQIGMPPITLYSFELKIELGFNNLRKSFFQTVSNSSWAHEGYLVAAFIDQSEEFREELKRLSSSFGISIIKLDTEDPDASSIIFPAQRKAALDWDTINKLANENKDFENFISRIKKDIATKEIRKEEFDKVLSRDNLIGKSLLGDKK